MFRASEKAENVGNQSQLFRQFTKLTWLYTYKYNNKLCSRELYIRQDVLNMYYKHAFTKKESILFC